MPDDSVYAPFSIARHEDGTRMELGRGAMGITYRATDTQLGRTVALKVINSTYLGDPIARQRFLAEARAAAQLHHSNVAGVFQLRAEGEDIFYAMEFVEGETVDAHVRRRGPLPSRLALRIILQAAQGLAAADERGLIHRDIKPANLMLARAPAAVGEGIEHEEEDGLLVKVIDFGLAKSVSGNDSGGGLTGGSVVGTPYFMSPEQISSESGSTLDCRSDIYSLGVTLWYLLLGRAPFEGSQFQILSQHLQKRPPLEQLTTAGVPTEIVALIGSMLAKDREERPANHPALIAALKKLLRSGGASTTARPAKESPRVGTTDGTMAMPATRADEGFWVAVLPFKYTGANAELTALAEGLSEGIVTGLSRFSYLRVIARSATSRYLSESIDVQSAGQELGARYVMEGSLRQAGSRLRVAVQLVDASSGAHLWAETYDRPFNPEAVFELQDDLVPRIVSTVADTRGVLPHTMSEALRSRTPDQLSPYEAVLRSFAYFERINAEEHAIVRTALERAVERAPGHADAWAILSILYREEYNHGFNLLPDPLGRAFAAARRAIETAPSNHYAHHALASVLFFRREHQAFRSAAQRAIALNSMDGFTIAYMGFLIAYDGDWERGCALTEQARSLNPHHPGWYWFAPLFDAYRKGDYPIALEIALKINMPGFWRTQLALAAIYGQLGELSAASEATRELLAIRPDFAVTAREELEKWWQPELVMQVIDGLRKAGLDLPEKGEAAPVVAPEKANSSTQQMSRATRSDEGFWIAVLPFKSSGGAEMESFADGLGEDITTGLSRFRYLSIVARASATQLKTQAGDERPHGAKPSTRYALEGSIRQTGTTIRVSAHLIDVASGAQLWAETYDRDLQASGIFAVQDDVATRIVATVADGYGVLVHAMASVLRQKDDADLPPVAWQFQYFAYREQLTPAALAALRSRVERAVERDDRQSDLWACFAQIYTDEYAFGFGGDATSLDRALAAGRRAVELDRANQFALAALARVHFFRRDLAAFRPAAERAMALNPLNTDALGILGLLIVHTGEFQRGAAIVRRAMELNNNHAGWMHFAPLWEHFQKGEYERALECANRVDVPGFFWPYVVVASACGHLGRDVEAKAAVLDLLALDPEFAAKARSNIASWHFASGLMEPILEGLRKAGLEIVPDKETGATAIDPATVSTSPSDSGAARADEGFWVAVLPFKYAGDTAELAALAGGLTEEIVTGMSRFSYLRVIARGSTLKYANQATDLRTVGKELGARYVMEGSLRQVGTKLRLAVQLVDAVSGAHLWAENFERTLSPETVFELQDDLVPRIVSTVADMYGVLVRSMSEALRGKADEELSPHEAVLSAFGYMERVTPEEHARVRRILERAVSMAPNQSDAWAMLANLYWEEHAHGLNPQSDPLGRALAAARRAVESAPSNNLAHYALASTLFFQKDFLAFRSAAERAIDLNRMDASVAAYIGNLIAYAGDWERGCAVVESAMQLNPRHPGWYWFANFNDAYRQRDYRGALGFALKINQPGNFYTHAVIAAAYGQLGMREEARKALQELLAIRPDFAKTAREEFGRWFHDLAFIEHQLDGLRKAGLEIAPEEASAAFPAPGNIPHSETKTESGAARAGDGFWVAVLPFKYSGANKGLATLADGLTEDIVTGLSRFSYLKVIARSSTSRYSNEAVDVRSAGKELGARYVMEGNLRQAGAKLRLAVQLVDAVSGAHLWAENYERTFSPEAVFELQDDLVPRIVSMVAGMNGVLPRSMSGVVRSRAPEQLSPYEAVLRSFSYFERVTAEELAAARSGLELAVEKAPAYADAWAMLALLCVQDYGQGFNLQADALANGSTAARRAVDAAPSSPLAYFSLAQALFFQREFPGFRHAAERAVALNPSDGNSIAFLGELLTYAGDWERGLALAERAKQLNPHHPGWYWYADFYNAYRRGDDRGALAFALKINLPGHWPSHAALAAAYGQLGERDAAARAVRELLKLRPDFAARVRRDVEKWWEPDYVERLVAGWRKAGVDVAN